jgi:hypothetical protein
MKRLLTLTTLLCLLSLASIAQTSATLGLYNDCRNDIGCTDLTLSHPLSSTTGIFAYGLKAEDYSEFYTGGQLKPTPNSEILLGIGAEQGQKSARFGGWSDITIGKVYLEYDYEFGGSGYWYKVKGLYSVTPQLAIGVLNKTTDNTGLEVTYQINPRVKVVADAYQESFVLGGAVTLW